MIRIIFYLLLFYVLFLYSAETASGRLNSIEILNKKFEKTIENENEPKVSAKEKCKAKIQKIEENIKQDTELIQCLKKAKHQSQR